MAAIRKLANSSNKNKTIMAKAGGTNPNSCIYRQNVPSLPENENDIVEIRKGWFKNKFEIEPPKLSPEEKSTLSELFKDKKDVDTKSKQLQIKIDSVTKQLRKVKEQINAVHNEEDNLQLQINSETVGEDLQTAASATTTKFVEKHKELMSLIANEEKLQNELNSLRRNIAECNIFQQNINLTADEHSNLIKTQELKNEFDYQRRMFKEHKIQKNIIKRYNTALRKIETDAEEQKQFEESDRKQHKQKIRQMKEAYTKLRVYRKDTFKKVSEQKLKSNADEELVNEKTYANVLALKSEIDKQRDMLYKEAKERTRRAKQTIEKRDKRRKLLIEQGENPFIQEYKVKLRKKEQQDKWAAVEQEQIAYHKLREEILEAERTKRKKEQDRNKWDTFWAEKAHEKRKSRIMKDRELIGLSKQRRPTLIQVIQETETAQHPFQHQLINFDLLMKDTFGELFEDDKSSTTTRSKKDSLPVSLPDYDDYAEFEGEPGEPNFSFETPGEDIFPFLVPEIIPQSKGLSISQQRKQSDEYKSKKQKRSKSQRSADADISRRSADADVEETIEEEVDELEVPKKSTVDRHIRILPKTKRVVKNPAADLFIIKPPAVIFKDFEIGKSYKKKAKIMNKSNICLKLYFDKFIECGREQSTLNLSTNMDNKPPPSTSTRYPQTPPNTAVDRPENEIKLGNIHINPSPYPSITDLVKIQFEVPKPICPGLSHEFYLTFRPTVLSDCQGEVHLTSPFGPVIIPVFCKRKRFDPHLAKELIQFKSVVGGTFGWMSVKLTNCGALPGHLTSIKMLDDTKNSARQYKRNQDNLLLTPRNTPTRKSIVRSKHAELAKDPLVRTSSSRPMSTVKFKPTKSSKVQSNTLAARSLTKTNMNLKYSKNKIAGTSSSSKSSSVSTSSRTTTAIKAKSTSTINDTALSFLDEIFEAVTDNIFTIHVKEKKRTLNPGQEVTLRIHFQPPTINYYTGKFELNFDNDDMGKLRLNVEGLAIENPITAEPKNTNFKICLMNFSYQQPIYFQNNSKYAGMIQASVPPLLKRCVEVFPRKAHSFPESTILFSVKFHPLPELLTREGIEDKIYDPVTSIIDFQIPFKLNFPFGTPEHITCTFQALLDEPKLEIQPKDINLGNCFVPEAIKTKITIRNNSVVPQHIGFVELPDYVTVLPGYGFTIILPGETRPFEAFISFGKSMIGDINFRIKVKTLEKKEYAINFKAVLSYSDVTFKSSKILFPATCYDSTSKAVAQLVSNVPMQSKRELLDNKFEFHIDENIPISIIPSSGNLGPSEKIKLLVKFEPKISSKDVQKALHAKISEKFQANKKNLNNELNAINQAINEKSNKKSNKKADTLQLAKTELKQKRNSKGRQSIEKDQLQERKKSSEASYKSSEHSQVKEQSLDEQPSQSTLPEILIKTFDDLQAIISDGSVDTTQSVKTLAKRKKFIVDVALQAELSLTTTNNISEESNEYINLKKKMISSLKSRVNEYNIPCLVTYTNNHTETLNLTVKCPTIHPDLVVLNETTINFGSVAVGEKVIREINLYNASIGHILPKVEIINPYGSFIQVNATRQIGPNETFILKIKFCPTKEGPLEDSFFISGGESKIMISLLGQGTRIDGR